jgi:hypothetical protein
MKAQENKQKQVLAHLKIWLLQGKTITQSQALKMWKTSRLAAYVYRLRHGYHQMKIAKTMIYEKNGDQYAKYKLEVKPKKKVNHRLV